MFEKQNQLKLSGWTYLESKNWKKADTFLQNRTTVALKEKEKLKKKAAMKFNYNLVSLLFDKDYSRK